ncbi:nuclear transport factor 2 family protein [Streptomyces sp. NPDC002667]|uniref:nuclear transport factor 2 family protein n=1 Tax=Streptomyces sp. NPDC002667 TaxID=3364657 RepID=UPI0036782C9D
MNADQPRTITPDDLPEVITRYLTAHNARDAATAVTLLTDDATVLDDGKSYQGAIAIEQWLNRATSEFTYTTRLTNAQEIDTSHYIATHHLEGDFPGGTIDLRFQFTLRDGLIEHLAIEA